jgi:hypothetical protein
MQTAPSSILPRLVAKIDAAEIDPQPSDNIFVEDVFELALYREILNRLPGNDAYDFIVHPDAAKPDGTSTRKLLALADDSMDRVEPHNRDFWRELCAALTSDELTAALLRKFHEKISAQLGGPVPEMIMMPVLYRDFPGYRIGVHPDADFKIATMQFYLPPDESQIHLGTSFHSRNGDQFHLLKTNPFKPNSAYAFARTENSYHSVSQLGAQERDRNTLALTLYVKGHEHRSGRKYE